MTGAAGRIEMAPGADLGADPLSWDWTPVTDDARVVTLAISRGKAEGGASEVQPSSMSFPVANPGGIHTPGRADSPYYPNLKRGMPVRAVIEGRRSPYLALTGAAGSRASTPDNAALDVVGDLAVAVEFECPLRMPPNNTTFYEVASKWSEAANLSWRFLLRPEGAMYLSWTTGGTTATELAFSGRLGVPRPDAGILTIGFYLDVDNGAAGRTVTFYVARGKTIDDLVASPTTYIHETQTASGTTSIFSGSAALELGDTSGSSAQPPLPGKVRRLIMRSGTMGAGSIVANPTFTTQAVGATSFTDSAGRAWTVNSSASVTDDQVRMLGELAGAAPIWPAFNRQEVAQVQWDVQGVLSRLRQGAAPVQSALYRIVTQPLNAGNVLAYWPLEDGKDSITGFSPIAGVEPMQVGGNWEFGADDSNPASNPNPHVDGTIAFSGQVPTSLRTIGLTQFRVDVMVKIDTPNVTPNGTNIIMIWGNGTVKRWLVSVDNTNVAVVGTDAFGAGLVSSVAAIGTGFFGGWTLWSFNVEQNGGNIDWSVSVVPASTGLATVYSGSLAGNVGICTGVSSWSQPAPSSGGISYGHIAVTKGLGLGWLAPADTAYRGEPAGRRFARLCQENGIQGLVDGIYSILWVDAIAAGAKPMGPQRPAKLLDLLEECALVEDARMGESREVRGLTYRSQHYNQAPALTVTNELGNPFEPTDDTQNLVNDATVSLQGGTSYRQVDAASISAAGVFADTRTVNAHSGLQLPDLTSWWLHEATWPGMRVPKLRVELGNNPALFDAWLATREGDLLRFPAPPTGFAETPLDVLLDGYTEEVSVYGWAVSPNVSPAGPWEVGVRNSQTLGIRDTGGLVLNSTFVAGTDTSMSVSTTLGPLWAVTAASNSALPFDVNVGGARITVTAIGAAAGSVQTFTVVQSPVNGIAKTVPAGTAVKVWRPARRSLLRRLDA